MKKSLLISVIMSVFTFHAFAENTESESAPELDVTYQELNEEAKMLIDAYKAYTEETGQSPMAKGNNENKVWSEILVEEGYLDSLPIYNTDAMSFAWDVTPNEQYIAIAGIKNDVCEQTPYQLDTTETAGDNEIFEELNNNVDEDGCVRMEIPQLDDTISVYTHRF